VASIYQRKSDGSWCGQYRVQTATGHKSKYVYAKTEKEARRKLKQAEKQAAQHGPITPDSGALTVGKYLEDWCSGIRYTMKHSGWRRHEQSIRLHISPTLSSVKLSKLTPLHLQHLYTERLNAGLAPRTVKIIHNTLHKSLNQAVAWSLIPSNPADAVKPPKAPDDEIEPLTKEQVKALLGAAQGNWYECLITLAVTTGARQGELLALQWRDVDFDINTLQIRRTIHDGEVGEPKTRSSRRTIALPRRAVDALKAHRDKQIIGDWIFPKPDGSLPSRAHLNWQWNRLLRSAGLPLDTKFHLLRHGAATMLLEANVNIKHIQAMLGHNSISTTMDIYAHHLRNHETKTADAMQNILEQT
jgi:integrase